VKWIAIFAALLGVFSPQLIATELEEIREKGALRVAVYKDFPPYSYTEQGTSKGIDVELGRALAQGLGVNVDYMWITADENMSDDLRNAIWRGHYLGGGTADVMLRVPYDLGYAEKQPRVLFAAPYAHEQMMIVFDRSQIPAVHQLRILKNHKVGAEIDSLGSIYLSSIFNGELTPSLLHYADFAEGVNAFKSGQIAALVGMRGQLEGQLGTLAENWTLQALDMRGFNSQWDIGVAVKADHTELAQHLNEIVTHLRKNGQLKEWFNQYGLSYTEPTAVN
jgi:ABC-type amino acid transport substrate-binding protein